MMKPYKPRRARQFVRACTGIGAAAQLICFVMCSFPALGQGIFVKGQVVAADTRSPLEGVNILLKGAGNGTTTNQDGYYRIEVRHNFYATHSSDTLVFSYAGFKTQSIPVNGRESINVTLSPLAAELEEVIVTGTAVGRSPKVMSYAVGHINTESLSAVPSPSVGGGLQGKIPGFRVNQVNGQPGQATYFQVRSANAIANGQQPLLIVDGIFTTGNLQDLNAEDIERVEVLKGSAGTSIYGSQAANGVIQIFTKRGRTLNVGDTQVTYRAEVGASEVLRQLDLNRFTNRDIIKAEGPQPVLGDVSPAGTFTTPLPNLQDYQRDLLFRRGLFQSHSLAVTGKSDQTNYLVSAQRLQDQGILQGFDGYTRHAFRANADHTVSRRVDLQISSLYSFSEQDWLEPTANGPRNYFANALFITPIFDLNTSNKENGKPFDWDIDNTGNGIINPLYDRANSRQTVHRSRLLGNFTANYYAGEWLTFSYSAAVDRADNNFEHFIEKDYLSTSPPGFFGTQATAGVQGSAGGGIQRSNRQSNYFTSRADVVFRRPFAGFNTAVRASFLYEDLTTRYNEAIGENLAVSGIRSLDNARSNIFIASEQQEIVGYSGFLIGDADYKQKFIFSGLVRREGTSLFGAKNRWANYYRASVAYRLTEDVRIKGIQELKIRASRGTSGIRPTFEQRFETFELINGVTTKNTLGNDALKPAYSIENEIGVDMTFAKAFTLEFNYSQINTEDQIVLAPLTGAAGFRGQWRNAGAIEAKVFEAGLNTNLKRLFGIRIPDFRWNVYTTFDRVRQTVIRLDVPSYVTGPGLQQSSLFLIEAGKPLGVMVGEVFATRLEQLAGMEGINPADYVINSAGYAVRKDQLGTPAERPVKLRDADGNPVVQEIGNITPDFRMGFTHHLGFRGFEIYTLFDWKKGGSIYNLTRHWLYRDFRHGDVGKHPEIVAGFYGNDGLYNSLVANNHFVEDGSFFMLREAAISYQFKTDILGGWLENVKLSLIGRNVFTKTKYSGFHPDVTSPPREERLLTNRQANQLGSDARTPGGDPSLFAVDAFNYPLPRTLTFSVQARF